MRSSPAMWSSLMRLGCTDEVVAGAAIAQERAPLRGEDARIAAFCCWSARRVALPPMTCMTAPLHGVADVARTAGCGDPPSPRHDGDTGRRRRGMPDDRISDGHISDDHISDGHIRYDHISDDHISDGQISGDHIRSVMTTSDMTTSVMTTSVMTTDMTTSVMPTSVMTTSAMTASVMATTSVQ
jgi:hypothetical protein